MSEKFSDDMGSTLRNLDLPVQAVFLAHVADGLPLTVNFPSGPVTFTVAQMRAALSPEALRALES